MPPRAGLPPLRRLPPAADHGPYLRRRRGRRPARRRRTGLAGELEPRDITLMAVRGGRRRSDPGGRRPGPTSPDPLRPPHPSHALRPSHPLHGRVLVGAIPRGALAGAAFAVPAVAWALLAHLPFAGQVPAPGRLLLVALVTVLLAASAETVRSVTAARRAAPWARHQPRRIGGPRSFGGLLTVQGLLHAALAAGGYGAGLRAAIPCSACSSAMAARPGPRRPCTPPGQRSARGFPPGRRLRRSWPAPGWRTSIRRCWRPPGRSPPGPGQATHRPRVTATLAA